MVSKTPSTAAFNTRSPGGGGGYPLSSRAKILSIAVASLEADGIACSDAGINPLRADPSNPASITVYEMDVRKAVCVKQIVRETAGMPA